MSAIWVAVLICVSCAALCVWAALATHDALRQINALLDQHQSFANEIIRSNQDRITSNAARIAEQLERGRPDG